MRIGEYCVRTATSTEGIQIKVEEALEIGWVPFGGVSVTTDRFEQLIFAQTMVRYEND